MKNEEDYKESPHLWDNYSDYSETFKKNKQAKKQKTPQCRFLDS